jgi:hypothetical protein
MYIKYIEHIYPPPHKYPLPCRTYFATLSFMFTSKISVQRGFSMYLSCEWIYCILVSWTTFITLSWSFPPNHYYSTAFSIYHYVIYLHRCNIFWYCLLSIILFSFPSSPEFHSSSEFSIYAYIYIYIYIFIYKCVYDLFLCLFIFWIYLLHMRENMLSLYFWIWLTYITHLMWCPPILSIYLQTT